MAKEFDVVQMRDGRIGTIIDILDEKAFILDVFDERGFTDEWPTAFFADIEKILYHA